MRRRLGLSLVALLVLVLVATSCAPAATPSPTQAPAAPAKGPEPAKPAGDATKPSAPAATKAPEAPKPAGEAPKPKGDAPKPAGEAPKPAAAKGGTLKIGYLTPLTGPSGGMGRDLRDGFLLYLEQKGGSLAGRKVEVIVEDDEMSPQAGLNKAKKLVERDNVQLLAGIISSGVAYGVVEYIKTQKMPLFLNNAGADDLTQRQFTPLVFRNSFANSQMVYPFGEWAYKKGYRKASVLAADYAAGYEYVGGFARTFVEAGGRIIQEQYPALGAPDPAPFITAVNPDADVLFTFVTGADAMKFPPTYEQYGMKNKIPLIGFSSLTDESILPKQGDSSLGLITAGPWTAALDTPANKAFMPAFEKKFNREVTFGAAHGYDGAMMLEKALEAIQGNIEDRDAFIKAMENVELKEATRGPAKFDKYHNIITSVYIMEVKKVNGKLMNTVIETFKDVSQFWKWSPEEYMKMPAFADLKGKWAK